MSVSQRLSTEVSTLEPLEIDTVVAQDTVLGSLTSGHGITETGASGILYGNVLGSCSSMC